MSYEPWSFLTNKLFAKVSFFPANEGAIVRGKTCFFRILNSTMYVESYQKSRCDTDLSYFYEKVSCSAYQKAGICRLKSIGPL
jgi:hypothetical protein